MNNDWIIFVYELILPFFMVALFSYVKPKSLISLVLNVLLAVLFVFTYYFIANWFNFSIYLKYIFLLFLLIGLYKNIREIKKVKLRIKRSWLFKIVFIFKILLVLFFGYDSYWVYKGLIKPEKSVELAFPFKKGTYAVFSGGGSKLLNRHFDFHPYWYAVDIVKINSYGRMWNNSLFLKSNILQDYPIYNDTVYSPCNGIILETNKNVVDNQIGMLTERSNFVRIKISDKYEVMLAHLKQNTIRVDSGDYVKLGEPIGLIGNSGKSSMPHLHIHVQYLELDIYRSILFDGNFLIKNEIIKK